METICKYRDRKLVYFFVRKKLGEELLQRPGGYETPVRCKLQLLVSVFHFTRYFLIACITALQNVTMPQMAASAVTHGTGMLADGREAG